MKKKNTKITKISLSVVKKEFPLIPIKILGENTEYKL